MGRFNYGFENLSARNAHLLLIELCAENSTIANKAYKLLSKLEKEGRVKYSRGESNICSICEEPYVDEKNDDTSCQFHDGDLESPYSRFSGSDYTEMHPEDYWWSCCGKRGSNDRRLGTHAMLREGCIKRRHMTDKEYREYSRKQMEEESKNSALASSAVDNGTIDNGVIDTNNNNKRPATASADNGSTKRLAVAAEAVTAEASPSSTNIVPIPVPAASPAAADKPAQPEKASGSDDTLEGCVRYDMMQYDLATGSPEMAGPVDRLPSTMGRFAARPSPARQLTRLVSVPSTLLFVLFAAILLLFTPGAAAESRARNPLHTIARLDDPVLHAPSNRVHALSTFQLSFTLTQTSESSGNVSGTIVRRLPVRLRLEPNHNILADDAAVHHMDADGNVLAVEPINRLDHRVFMGHAFIPAGHAHGPKHLGQSVLAADENHWINAGWASIYIFHDGDRPVFEGTFHLAGDHHHIQTSQHYLQTRIPGDPPLPGPSSDDVYDASDSMVVWRSSDIMSDSDVRRRSLASWADDDSLAALANLELPGCSSDSLLFNADPMRRVVQEDRWLFGRQIDTSSSGNGVSVNLSSTIGSTTGCPTTRKVALMGIAADCTYAALFSNKTNTSAHIVQQINSASRVYENTFNISLGIRNLLIQDTSCPSNAASTATPWNADCSSNLTISDRLNLFSAWRGKSSNDTNAFWTLLSTCATGSAVGLAWKGQLCVTGAQTSSNDTVAATNVVVRTSTEWQVMAHEIGHTFGAVHDCTSDTCSNGAVTSQQCCPLSASTCNANGKYIMNPSTSDGVTDFSPCTIGNICSAMGYNSVKSSCLSNNKDVTTITGSECGNGIVETGEECDCGGTEGCGSNSCCDPTTCKFTANSLCDPANDECCTSSCQLASSGTVCRASTGSCDPAETCSGKEATCPSDVTTPDGTTCGASGNGLTCASGQCTSRDLQCKTVMGSLTTTNDTYACSSDGCQLSCASPDFGINTCMSMNQNFLDGTPCQGGGTCSNGQCTNVSVNKEIKSWIKSHLNIVIPVAVVAGLLVLMVLYGCISSMCRRSRRTPRYQKGLAPRGGPMGVPPPMMAGGGGGWPGYGGGYDGSYGGGGSGVNGGPPPPHGGPNTGYYGQARSVPPTAAAAAAYKNGAAGGSGTPKRSSWAVFWKRSSQPPQSQQQLQQQQQQPLQSPAQRDSDGLATTGLLPRGHDAGYHEPPIGMVPLNNGPNSVAANSTTLRDDYGGYYGGGGHVAPLDSPPPPYHPSQSPPPLHHPQPQAQQQVPANWAMPGRASGRYA